MNTQKQTYLRSIRSASTYPTFRVVIGFVTILLYVLAGVVALLTLVAMANSQQMPASGPILFLAGATSAACIVILARFLKEAALILADIGDALVESNSRAISS